MANVWHVVENQVSGAIVVMSPGRAAGFPTIPVSGWPSRWTQFPKIATVYRSGSKIGHLELTAYDGSSNLSTSGYWAAEGDTADFSLDVGDVLQLNVTKGLISEIQAGIDFEGSGISDSRFVYRQMMPSASWSIVHNLGKFPGVTVVDSANSDVIGEVTYVDLNHLVIAFNGSFSGSAYLN